MRVWFPLNGFANRQLFQQKCTNQPIFHQSYYTEESDNAIRLLKTDLNTLLCLLEIYQSNNFFL